MAEQTRPLSLNIGGMYYEGDLNNLSDSGIYDLNLSTTSLPPNVDANASSVFVLKHDNDNIKQLFLGRSVEMYYRTKRGGTWNEWEALM